MRVCWSLDYLSLAHNFLWLLLLDSFTCLFVCVCVFSCDSLISTEYFDNMNIKINISSIWYVYWYYNISYELILHECITLASNTNTFAAALGKWPWWVRWHVDAFTGHWQWPLWCARWSCICVRRACSRINAHTKQAAKPLRACEFMWNIVNMYIVI